VLRRAAIGVAPVTDAKIVAGNQHSKWAAADEGLDECGPEPIGEAFGRGQAAHKVSAGRRQ
jgi:hypothetical protein